MTDFNGAPVPQDGEAELNLGDLFAKVDTTEDKYAQPSVEQRQAFMSRSFDLLEEIMQDESQQELVEKFRFTFEQRRRAPWLQEASTGWGGEPVDVHQGMANILKRDLFYICWRGAEAEFSDVEHGRSEVDEEFMSQLSAGLALGREQVMEFEAQENEHITTNTEWLFHYKGLSVDTPDEELRAGLVNSLRDYHRNTFAYGYSGDPW